MGSGGVRRSPSRGLVEVGGDGQGLLEEGPRGPFRVGRLRAPEPSGGQGPGPWPERRGRGRRGRTAKPGASSGTSRPQVKTDAARAATRWRRALADSQARAGRVGLEHPAADRLDPLAGAGVIRRRAGWTRSEVLQRRRVVAPPVGGLGGLEVAGQRLEVLQREPARRNAVRRPSGPACRPGRSTGAGLRQWRHSGRAGGEATSAYSVRPGASFGSGGSGAVRSNAVEDQRPATPSRATPSALHPRVIRTSARSGGDPPAAGLVDTSAARVP